jgi:hypothetical protein
MIERVKKSAIIKGWIYNICTVPVWDGLTDVFQQLSHTHEIILALDQVVCMCLVGSATAVDVGVRTTCGHIISVAVSP